MNRMLKTMLIGASVASLAVVSAFAQERADRRADPKPRATESEIGKEATNPEVATDAPNARLAALILRDLRIPRNKGVNRVRRPAVGVYCIRPTAGAAINPATIVVNLTPEYF